MKAKPALLLLSLAACAAPPLPDHPVSFTPFRELSQAEGDHPVQFAWADGVEPGAYDIIVLAPVEIAPSAELDEEERQRWAGYVRDWVLYDLRSSGKFELVTDDAFFLKAASWDRRVLSLRLHVGHLYKGYGFLRLYLGFGLGAAQLALEGEGTDAGTGEVVFQFLDCRKESGMALFGLNWKVAKSDHVLLLGFRDLTRDAVRFVRSRLAPEEAGSPEAEGPTPEPAALPLPGDRV